MVRLNIEFQRSSPGDIFLLKAAAAGVCYFQLCRLVLSISPAVSQVKAPDKFIPKGKTSDASCEHREMCLEQGRSWCVPTHSQLEDRTSSTLPGPAALTPLDRQGLSLSMMETTPSSVLEHPALCLLFSPQTCNSDKLSSYYFKHRRLMRLNQT